MCEMTTAAVAYALKYYFENTTICRLCEFPKLCEWKQKCLAAGLNSRLQG